MSLEKATLYMDTIVTYFAPRACLVLDLGCDLKDYVSSTKVISQEAAGLTASPNPSADYVMIQSESKMIKGIVLFDATGRTIKAIPSINNKQFRLERNNMPTGVYYAQVQFENATATVKLSFIK